MEDTDFDRRMDSAAEEIGRREVAEKEEILLRMHEVDEVTALVFFWVEEMGRSSDDLGGKKLRFFCKFSWIDPISLDVVEN